MKFLPSLISSQQLMYVQKLLIRESSRLIADIIEVTDIFNKEGFLVTANIKKVFDSLDYAFFLFLYGKNLDLVIISLVGLKP